MRRIFRAVLPALALIAVAIPPVEAADAPDYEALVARVKSGDDSVDFGQLREAYIKSAGYDPYSVGIMAPNGEMQKAASRKDCKTALDQARQITEMNFVFIDAHLISAYCYDMIGQPADAARARKIGQGLVASIMKSGDGKSPETAFAVVSVAEEYTVLAVLGLRRKGQSLVSHNGRAYDRLDAMSAKSSDPNATVAVYFLVDPILAKMSRELGAGPTPEAGKAPASPARQ